MICRKCILIALSSYLVYATAVIALAYFFKIHENGGLLYAIMHGSATAAILTLFVDCYEKHRC